MVNNLRHLNNWNRIIFAVLIGASIGLLIASFVTDEIGWAWSGGVLLILPITMGFGVLAFGQEPRRW